MNPLDKYMDKVYISSMVGQVGRVMLSDCDFVLFRFFCLQHMRPTKGCKICKW